MLFDKKIFSHISYAFFNVTLISVVLLPYLRSLHFDPIQLSSAQSIQQIFWFIFLFISGFLFDIYGAKTTFIFGRICEIICIWLLLSTNFYIIILAMMFTGVGKGVTYGKYTSYIYNTLSIDGKLDVYPRIASIYYFTWDISLSLMSFLSALILKNHTYDVLIYASIVIKIIALIFVIIFVPSDKKNPKLQDFKSSSIKDVFSSIYFCAKKNHVFMYLLLFYGMLNFFTYPLCLTIADMILMDKGHSAHFIAQYTMYITVSMALGAFISGVFFPRGISVARCMILSVAQMIIMSVAAIVYDDIIFMIIAGFICFTFSLVEVSVERRFEEFSNKKIRGSAASVSIAIGTVFSIVNIMLIGYIAKYYNYHYGLMFVVIQILLLLLFLYLKLKHIKHVS